MNQQNKNDEHEIAIYGARAEQMVKFLKEKGAKLVRIERPADGHGFCRYMFIEDDDFYQALSMYEVKLRRGYY